MVDIRHHRGIAIVAVEREQDDYNISSPYDLSTSNCKNDLTECSEVLWDHSQVLGLR